MNNYLEDKLGMYQKVEGYLTQNATATASIAAVATLKTQLTAGIQSIFNFAVVADADVTGATVDKHNKRMALKAAILKISTAMTAYGAISNNQKLREKCDLTPSKLDHLRDNDFYTYAKVVSAEATPIMTALTPYGATAADLTTLNTASTTYLAAIQDPRLQINDTSRARIDYEMKFAEIDELLRDKLDPVMRIFEVTNASLYNGYIGARAVDSTGGGATPPDYDGKVQPNTIDDIASLPYLSGRLFYFQNTGNVPLSFALSNNPQSQEGLPIMVAPNETRQRITSSLNADGISTYLSVKNADPNVLGSYKIWLND